MGPIWLAPVRAIPEPDLRSSHACGERKAREAADILAFWCSAGKTHGRSDRQYAPAYEHMRGAPEPGLAVAGRLQAEKSLIPARIVPEVYVFYLKV